MKLYTRRGDAGQTDLFGGTRVPKDDLRVEAYGTVDELNALIGLCLAGDDDGVGKPFITQALATPLRAIQSRLFEIGADLATPEAPETPEDEKVGKGKGASARVPRVSDGHIAELEGWIDDATARTTPMTGFILPGGTELSARLHVARTVCRRAERRCVALSAHETVGPLVIVYLNRLSDLLFALARQANHAAGVADVPWVKP